MNKFVKGLVGASGAILAISFMELLETSADQDKKIGLLWKSQKSLMDELDIQEDILLGGDEDEEE